MAQHASRGASLATHCTACLGSRQLSVPFAITGSAARVIAADRHTCTWLYVSSASQSLKAMHTSKCMMPGQSADTHEGIDGMLDYS